MHSPHLICNSIKLLSVFQLYFPADGQIQRVHIQYVWHQRRYEKHNTVVIIQSVFILYNPQNHLQNGLRLSFRDSHLEEAQLQLSSGGLQLQQSTVSLNALCYSRFFKCEYFLASFLLNYIKLNIFEMWTEQYI